MLEIFGAPISSITGFCSWNLMVYVKMFSILSSIKRKYLKAVTAIQSQNTCNLKFSDNFH